MISKIIHYAWFGNNEYPPKVEYCIDSWKKALPDYEFKLWNESTFDFSISKFAKEAYDAKKYAFVSDYVRVYALYNEGGIYLDTDIEVIKPFDDLLNNEILLGTDDAGFLTAFMAAKKEHVYFKDLLEKYNSMPFVLPDGQYNSIVNNVWMQECLSKYGYVIENKFQKLQEGICVYPDTYFHAKSLVSGKYHITSNTYCIHHHTLLWIPLKTRIMRFIRMNILVPIIGKDRYVRLTKRLKRK